MAQCPSRSEAALSPAPPDTHPDIAAAAEIPRLRPSPLGAGELILVSRELKGWSQRRLAACVATSQPALARLETGSRIPTVRTLLRIAEAAGLELVLGLRRPGAPRPDPEVLGEMGFALLGTLHRNEEDDLADFVTLREPSPFEGPG